MLTVNNITIIIFALYSLVLSLFLYNLKSHLKKIQNELTSMSEKIKKWEETESVSRNKELSSEDEDEDEEGPQSEE